VPLKAADLIQRWAKGEDHDAAVTRVAASLGVGSRTLYRWLSEETMPPDQLAPLAEVLGPELGRELLQEAAGDNFAVIALEEPPAEQFSGSSPLLAQAVRALQECGEAVAEISRAISDREITRDEAARVIEESRDAVAWLHVMIRRCRSIAEGVALGQALAAGLVVKEARRSTNIGTQYVGIRLEPERRHS
jgi:transposase-like protein